eukprot:scaffold166562_cov12-Tisochrysis_lutea.AAC.1
MRRDCGEGICRNDHPASHLGGFHAGEIASSSRLPLPPARSEPHLANLRPLRSGAISWLLLRSLWETPSGRPTSARSKNSHKMAPSPKSMRRQVVRLAPRKPPLPLQE